MTDSGIVELALRRIAAERLKSTRADRRDEYELLIAVANMITQVRDEQHAKEYAARVAD